MKHILLPYCFLLSLISFGQTQSEMNEIEKGKFYRGFELVENRDTIRFFVISKPGEELIKKPIILYRQGSLPIPIFTRYPEGVSINSLPQQFPDYLKEYHMVSISKPGVPLIFNSSEVNQYFEKVRNGRLTSDKYLNNNNLNQYVASSDKVLGFLIHQPWVDTKKVVLVGGSEGYNVAAKLATINKSVTHLVAYSSHPNGRFDYLIKEQRHQYLTGKATAQETQQRIDSLYVLWKDICAHPKSIDKKYYDTYYAWSSFSEPAIESLLQLDIPIYISYGTLDGDWDIVEENDLLPIRFARAGKTNLTLKPCLDCDHSLQEIKKDSQGNVIEIINRSEEFVKNYMNWLDQN
ncbi:hypothetical protein [Salmonirosea aquatica]|uniref:Dienelactone hydrolase domain-containing protein n=1 Tax=Salmonirosea aquatica TaxID=2654236 RepID=A0A7C9FX36_9BACT|nr:hypothetical protein [Cytophagaceae bacterium SJW1-29]